MAFKKISDLNPNLTPSGSGIIPISQDGQTFGSTLDTIKGQIEGNLTGSFALTSSVDELTLSVNQATTSIDEINVFTSSADGRLNSLESFTGSLDDSFATDLELQEFREYFNTYTSSNDNVNTGQNNRLDILESSLSGQTTDLSVVNGRLDSLETETGSLNNKIDVEKGRIDAILLSADADKDSFAEIVELINSVDTENDQAFANYVLQTDGRLDSIESKSGSWITLNDLPPQPTPQPTPLPVDLSPITGRLDALEIESGSIRNDFNLFTASYLEASQSFNQRITDLLEIVNDCCVTPTPTPEPTATPIPTATEVPPTATPQPTPTDTPVPTATEVPPTGTPQPTPTNTPVPTATEVPPTPTAVVTSAFITFSVNHTTDENGNDIWYQFDAVYDDINGIQRVINSQQPAPPNGTVSHELINFPETPTPIILILRRLLPDGSTVGNGVVDIQVTTGNYTSIFSDAVVQKILPYSFGPNTTINGGSDWSWTILGAERGLEATFSVSESPLPTSTPVPTSTDVPQPTPTDTPVPTATEVPPTPTPTTDYTLFEYMIVWRRNTLANGMTYDFTRLDGNGDYFYSNEQIKCVYETFGTGGGNFWNIAVGDNSEGLISVGDDSWNRVSLGNPTNIVGSFSATTRGVWNDVTDRLGNGAQHYIVTFVSGEVTDLVSFDSIGDVSGCVPYVDPTPTPTATVEPTPTSTDVPQPTPTPTVEPTGTPVPNPTPTPTVNLQDITLVFQINNDGGVNPWLSGTSTYNDVQNHLCTYGANNWNQNTRQTTGDPNNPQTGDRFYAGGFPIEPAQNLLYKYNNGTSVSDWRWIEVDGSGYITVSGFTCSTPTPTATVQPTPTSTEVPPTATPTDTPVPTSTSTPIPSPTPTVEPTGTPEPNPTPTVEPTGTPVPNPTATPTPQPTATAFPLSCLTSNTTVQVLSGKYEFNGSYDSYGANTGTYTLQNVPSSHPIAFLNNGKESLISYTGVSTGGTKTAGDGNTYTYYYGDVIITVNGDFGTISYECYYHGYMGGEDNLTYSSTCSSPSPTPTGTPEPSPTPTVEPTGTPVPNPTPTVEPTGTPVPNPTPTVEPTGTPAPNPTATPTPTVEPTGTPEPNPTPTVEPTGTPEPNPTPTVEPTGTPEPTPTSTEVPPSTPTPTPTVTSGSPPSTPTPTPTLEFAPTATPTPTATVDGANTIFVHDQ